MSHALMVFVATTRVSRHNLAYGLNRGRWAFPGSVRSPDLEDLEVGDLVFFGVGGDPRAKGGGKFDGWRRRVLGEAFIARVASLPFMNEEPFWPDELRSGVVRWNPTVEIELLRQLDQVPLEGGAGLSEEATNALYRGAVANRVNRVTTDGCSLFDEFPRGVLPPVLVGRRSIDAIPAAGNGPVARRVGLRSQRLLTAPVRQRERTTAEFAEAQLVDSYATYLRRHGDHVSGLVLDLPRERIEADLYVETRHLLVEAKKLPSRMHIRLAIGQLFDYGRAKGYETANRAVLVPERPSADLLALLAHVRIDAIWQERSGFRDTRDGRWC